MPFQPFDLGQVLQTAEAIKGARRQSVTDMLQQQFMGKQMANLDTQAQYAANRENREATTFSQEQQLNNTRLLNAAAAAVMRDPNAAQTWLPQLIDAGVATPELDLAGNAQTIFESTSAALQSLSGQVPVQYETLEGPDGSLLQRDPTTGELRSVLGRERPPPQTNVTVNSGQETEESKAIGKALGEQYAQIQQAGTQSGYKIARYERIGNLLEGVRTGRLTPKFTDIAALADSIGITLDPNLGEKQAAQALSNEIALQLRNPSGGAGMPGALSDKDREFLVSMTPGLANTPEGNKLLIETAIKLARREQDVAKVAREYRARNRSLEGFSEHLAQWSEQNPLFSRETTLMQQGGAADFIYVPGQGLRPRQ